VYSPASISHQLCPMRETDGLSRTDGSYTYVRTYVSYVLIKYLLKNMCLVSSINCYLEHYPLCLEHNPLCANSTRSYYRYTQSAGLYGLLIFRANNLVRRRCCNLHFLAFTGFVGRAHTVGSTTTTIERVPVVYASTLFKLLHPKLGRGENAYYLKRF
jgi:hypothetical protein